MRHIDVHKTMSISCNLFKIRTILCSSICIIVFFFLNGCQSEKSNDNTLIQFDVRASYPEKAIRLEDVADIEYLQLEFDEEFLYQRPPHIITSRKIITGFNGDILIFSREGKPLSKFNRLGSGPQDYPTISQLLYDESLDEFYVRSQNKIVVYTTSGNFKRVIPLPNGTWMREIANFDSVTFLHYDNYDLYPARFSFISKENGNVVATVSMPKDKNINVSFSQVSGNNVNIFTAPAYHFVRHNNGYLLTDFSLDTVYYLSNKKKLAPMLVRKPAIQSMDPIIYLNSFLEAGNYEFVSAITLKNDNNQLPRTYLMRDKKSGSVYRQNITFNDYRGKQVTLSPETIANTQKSKLGLIVLGLVELQEANNENKLSGKLKELVENSDDDANDIYMLLHFK